MIFGVWLKKQRIRFYGIDTPESRTSDKVEKIYGLMAKEVVLSYLPVGSTQTLRTRQDGKGKYGRILGEFLIHDAKTDAHAPERLFPLAVATALSASADTSAPDEPTTIAESDATSSCFCASDRPSRLDTTILFNSEKIKEYGRVREELL